MDLDIYGSAAAGASNGSAAASRYGSPVSERVLEPGGKSQSHLVRTACQPGSHAATQAQPPHTMIGSLPSARVSARQTRVIPPLTQDAPSSRARYQARLPVRHAATASPYRAPHGAGSPSAIEWRAVCMGVPSQRHGGIVAPVSKGKRVKKIGS